VETAEAAIAGRALALFTRIDHSAAAQGIGLQLPSTMLLIFGSAAAGTALMQASPTLAIDLPLKLLIWSDTGGATWLAYNDPTWLADRHGIVGRPLILAMRTNLDSIAAASCG